MGFVLLCFAIGVGIAIVWAMIAQKMNKRADEVANVYERIVNQKFPNIKFRLKHDFMDRANVPNGEEKMFRVYGCDPEIRTKFIRYLRGDFKQILIDNNIPILPLDIDGQHIIL